MGSYPLIVHDQRRLPEGYRGSLFVWDIDKTYLATRFSSVKGILRIPVEFAVDKIAIPGMPEVLRGLRQGPGEEYSCSPLYFVTASPPQIRKVLEHKMLLDGVEYDGITTKDWLATLVRLRPGRLHEQIGFKLCALLTGRKKWPLAKEYLFGDDVEKDALAFDLYARLLSGEISAGDADEMMSNEGVRGDDRRSVFELLESLPPRKGEVERIFIHLEQDTPPAEFEKYGERTVPVKGALQMGLALYQMDLLDSEAVAQIHHVLESRRGPQKVPVARLSADAVSRDLITKNKLKNLGL